MALATIDMCMRADVWALYEYYMGANERFESEVYSGDESITMPVEVCFLITGGQVKVYMNTHPGDEVFTGMLVEHSDKSEKTG